MGKSLVVSLERGEQGIDCGRTTGELARVRETIMAVAFHSLTDNYLRKIISGASDE